MSRVHRGRSRDRARKCKKGMVGTYVVAKTSMVGQRNISQRTKEPLWGATPQYMLFTKGYARADTLKSYEVEAACGSSNACACKHNNV